MRHTTRIILGMLLGALSISQVVLANHHDGWNNGGWDYAGSEGQSCYGHNSCSYGLVCYDNGRSGYATCRRPCNSYYDCHAGQYCSSDGYYTGICVYDGEGGGRRGGGGRGGRGGRGGAYEGDYCSPRGDYYPRCGPTLYCETRGRDSVGICRSR